MPDSGGSYGASGLVLAGFKLNIRRQFQIGNLDFINNHIFL